MAFPISGHHCKSQTSKVPLLMERADTHNDNEHVIDIPSTGEASSSSSSHERPASGLEQQHGEDHPSTSARVPVHQPPLFSAGSNPRNPSMVRRGNSRGRQRSPLNSGLWITVELVLTLSQVIAAVIVLSLSKNEKPHAPLRAWIDASQLRQDTSQGDNDAGPLTRRVMEGEDRLTTGTSARGTQSTGLPNSRLKVYVEYFKMGLDCFFAVWFVVGNVWIFGGHSSSAESPNLYRLCIVFLAFSCIGYAMPFILCTTICCCLPCIISVLGIREDFPQNRGATQDSINSLPTYKFKVKKNKSGDDKDNSSGAEYVNNDELRELPCSHFFHKECVDKWLRINATCPLCKAEVGETILTSLTDATASLRNSTV
ncbi:E3 ubiquitin-protein ligase [Sesamum angolense]|uniref:E3 ubiquitin-protein ligase n=1 Tax=Sesamum angolense TaxID=2727404 RepID=A0AAE1WXP6_9LAMI|nr:E3 ubiquitin-protein ligase [Sesamum angolense]